MCYAKTSFLVTLIFVILNSVTAFALDLRNNNDRYHLQTPTLSGAYQAAIVRDRNRRYFHRLTRDRNFVGVEVLSSHAPSSPMRSSFSHMAILLIDERSDPMDNIVISFEMEILDESRAFQASIEQSYAFIPKVYQLREYFNDYLVDRDNLLRRHILYSTPEMRERLVELISLVMDVPVLIGNYNFVSNNCMSAVMKVLNGSGFNLIGGVIDIPLLFTNLLRTNLQLHLPPQDIVGRSDLTEVTERLSERYQFMLNKPELRADGWEGIDEEHIESINSKVEGLRDLIQDLSDEELNKLDILWSSRLGPRPAYFVELIDELDFPHLPFADIVGFESFPNKIYDLCDDDEACLLEKKMALVDSFGLDSLYIHFNQMSGIRRSEMQRDLHLARRGQRGLDFFNSSIVLENEKTLALLCEKYPELECFIEDFSFIKD